MKNIHVLPTEKPSRIRIGDNRNFVIGSIQTTIVSRNNSFTNQHIYITSDEEIKVNDYITDGYVVWKWKDDSSLLGRKKVILTTDQDLIGDGIQVIDDDFLEWFVKNPSCELVPIANEWGEKYKIIIPKEQQKQHLIDIMQEDERLGLYDIFNDEKRQGVKELIDKHILEEASWKFNPLKKLDGEFLRHAFKEGAKWQQERSYSEEEMKISFEANVKDWILFEEFIEQFKNK